MIKTILTVFSLSIFISATTLAQIDDKGFDFGGATLPESVQGLSNWEVIPEVSDDFNYEDKKNKKFTDTWAEAYLPDPGFVGPGQTRWVQRETDEPEDPNVVKVNGAKGILEVRSYPGGNNPESSDPKLDRFIKCGIVTAKQQVKYPIYMESRIKISNLENSSNFWLLNACDNEELDILECYGGAKMKNDLGEIVDNKFFTSQMSTNYHIWHRKGGQTEPTLSGLENCGGGILTDFTYQTFFTTDPTNANPQKTPNFRDDYHTFGMLWTSPTDITYYLDGVARTNGKHFVNGRQATGLTSTFKDAKLQCPRKSIGTGCETLELLSEVQGLTSGGSPYPNRKMDDATFIIIDTESHANKKLESIENLNDDTKNVIQVDWVRVYKPVGVSSIDREKQLVWDNPDEFKTPSVNIKPIFEAGETVDIKLSYQTKIKSMVEQNLSHISIKIVELDQTNTPVKTSISKKVLSSDALNKDTATITYTLPTYFDAENTDAIPTLKTLDSGHKLMVSFSIQEQDNTVFSQNTDIVIVSDKEKYLSEPSEDEDSNKEILVSPNPSSEKFTILSEINKGWELYDLLGRLVAKGTEKIVNTNKLSSGVYVLVIDENKRTKVVKE